MATKLEIWLGEEDMERLWAAKEKQGEAGLTAQEFAQELLHSKLIELQPEVPEVEPEDEGFEWG